AIVVDTGAGLVSGSRYDGVIFEISGGSASNVLLENGGQLTVLSGHTVTDTHVSQDGLLLVENGGALDGDTIISGNGVLSGSIVINEGSLRFLDTSSATTFSGSLLGSGSLIVEGGALMLQGQLSQDGGVHLIRGGQLTMDRLQAFASVTGGDGTTVSLKGQSMLTGTVQSDGRGLVDVSMTSAQWNITGDSQVGQLYMDDGTVSWLSAGIWNRAAMRTSGTSWVTLTVASLSGSGAFNMRTDLASISGDLLKVTGNATGNFTLSINNMGAEPESGASAVRIVQTGGGGHGLLCPVER
ncbi:autotransporter outer membrane beta-barrel domain-containing protein, partial [Escherichia coli]|nr:autotransporter outer membrane beta-barrel domain-containing protein [Escherichia coli]